MAGKGLLRVVFYSAILFSVFQLVTSAFSPISSTVVRALHVGFLLLLTFLLHPLQGGQGRTSLLTKAVGFGALLLSGYHWIYEADLVERAGEMWNTWVAERWDTGDDMYAPFMERIEARIAAASVP